MRNSKSLRHERQALSLTLARLPIAVLLLASISQGSIWVSVLLLGGFVAADVADGHLATFGGMVADRPLRRVLDGSIDRFAIWSCLLVAAIRLEAWWLLSGLASVFAMNVLCVVGNLVLLTQRRVVIHASGLHKLASIIAAILGIAILFRHHLVIGVIIVFLAGFSAYLTVQQLRWQHVRLRRSPNKNLIVEHCVAAGPRVLREGSTSLPTHLSWHPTSRLHQS